MCVSPAQLCTLTHGETDVYLRNGLLKTVFSVELTLFVVSIFAG